jgi:hypothetical protein
MATTRETIHLGEITLAGYTGVDTAQAPARKTLYGYVALGGLATWGWDNRPAKNDIDQLGLRPRQSPKYSVTVVVPHMMMGTLHDRMPGLVEEAECLRRSYRRAGL